jgi:hypothetical protein
MTALSANRDTREVVGALSSLTVKANTSIYAGALVAIDATGEAVPAADAAGLKVIGRAEHAAVGGYGLLVKRGVFLYDNHSGDPLAVADIGAYCYVSDDQTVQASANGNGVVAGLVRGVTPDGVYVDTTMNPDGSAAGANAGESAGASAGAAAVTAALAAEGSIAIAIASAIAAAGNVRLVEPPASANADGVKGDLAIDATDIYLCTDTDTWVKAPLAFATW